MAISNKKIGLVPFSKEEKEFVEYLVQRYGKNKI
jgi:hypothetical protein